MHEENQIMEDADFKKIKEIGNKFDKYALYALSTLVT